MGAFERLWQRILNPFATPTPGPAPTQSPAPDLPGPITASGPASDHEYAAPWADVMAQPAMDANNREKPTPEQVAEARRWADEKLANTPPDNSHPEYTKEQIRAAQEELKGVNADLYRRVQEGELEHPNATPEELRMAVEGDENGNRVPLTWKDNPEAWAQFQNEVKQTFETQGVMDAVVQQIGSGTQGWKGNPIKYLQWKEKVESGETDEPWETYGAWKPSSDTDFAVFSDQALVQAMEVDAPINSEYGVFKNGLRPGMDPAFPDGKPGIIHSELGGQLSDLSKKYNEIIYGDPEPGNGGFDFKLNVKNEPFTRPPDVYRGPEAEPRLPPIGPAPEEEDKGFFGHMFDAIGNVGGGVFSGLGNVLGGVGNGILDVGGGILNGIGAVGGGVVSGAGAILGGVGSGILDVGGGIVDGIGAAGGGIVSGVEHLFGGLGSGFHNLAEGDIISGLGDIVGGVGRGVWDVASGIGEGVWDVASGIGKGIWDVGGGIVSGVGNVLGGVGEGIWDVASGIGNGILDVGGGILSGIGAVGGGLISGISDVGAAIGSLLPSISLW